MQYMVETKNLRKVYRTGDEKVVALDNIDLAIEQGQVCCILGTSGSGKSTLLNQLAGLEKPTRGTVKIRGELISKMSEKQLAVFRQKHIGFVFQSYNLIQGMTAVENVAMPLMFRRVSRKKREAAAREMLMQVGLGERMEHRPNEMSGGQQQRVGIARAFVTNPEVVFADEPTGNLDTVTTRKVLGRILKMAKENGITFVMVTHERELAGCADRVVTISDGNVQSDRVLTEEEKAAGRAALGVDQLEDLDVADALAHEKEESGSKPTRKSKHLFKNPIKIKRNAK